MEGIDELRQQLADLREENRILKELLKRNRISFKEYAPSSSYRISIAFSYSFTLLISYTSACILCISNIYNV